MKNKFMIIGGAIIAVILVVILIIAMLPEQQKPVIDPTDSSSASETISTNKVEIEDIDETDSTTSTDEGAFIEPDESEADKIIEEHIEKNEPTTSRETSSKEPIKTETPKDKKSQTFEDSKKELKDNASDSLNKHNVNPKTAGETGENCPHCGKKIWDPNKYGLNVPGYPKNYENSNYCTGACAITFG